MHADLSALALSDRPEGARFSVHVRPRASREAVGGLWGSALVVSVTAPPVDGAANLALARALSRALAVPARAVRVVAGQTGRQKVVEVSGLRSSEVRARLGGGS